MLLLFISCTTSLHKREDERRLPWQKSAGSRHYHTEFRLADNCNSSTNGSDWAWLRLPSTSPARTPFLSLTSRLTKTAGTFLLHLSFSVGFSCETFLFSLDSEEVEGVVLQMEKAMCCRSSAVHFFVDYFQGLPCWKSFVFRNLTVFF